MSKWKLVNVHTETEVKVGDTVSNWVGLQGVIAGLAPPPDLQSGAPGRVTVRFRDEHGQGVLRETFPAFVDCRFMAADGHVVVPHYKLYRAGTDEEVNPGDYLDLPQDGRKRVFEASIPPNARFPRGKVQYQIEGELTYQGKPRLHTGGADDHGVEYRRIN